MKTSVYAEVPCVVSRDEVSVAMVWEVGGEGGGG